MHQLLPRPECDRHVRASEPSCPFCGGAFPAGRNVMRAAPQIAGLGRAAIMAFGAAAAIGVTGCGDDGSPGMDGGRTDGSMMMMDDGGLDSGGGGPVDAYGAPPFDGGADGGTAAAYGAPPDAGQDGGTSAALYGAPPEP